MSAERDRRGQAVQISRRRFIARAGATGVAVGSANLFLARAAAARATEPARSAPRMRVALVGASYASYHNYAPYQGIPATVRAAGMGNDRVNVGDGSNLTELHESVAAGYHCIALYDPARWWESSAQEHADAVVSLAHRMTASNLGDVIIFINEPWYLVNGSTSTPGSAATYGTYYATARKALKSARSQVTLTAGAFGDWYDTGDGTWHEDARGEGWVATVIAQMRAAGLSAGDVSAWNCHPYPGRGTAATLGDPHHVASISDDDTGFPCLGRFQEIAVSLGSRAPWYVDEFGARVTSQWTAAQQASALKTMTDCFVTSVPAVDHAIAARSLRYRTPFRNIVWAGVYAVVDDNSTTARWGVINEQGDARPAFGVMKAFAAHVA